MKHAIFASFYHLLSAAITTITASCLYLLSTATWTAQPWMPWSTSSLSSLIIAGIAGIANKPPQFGGLEFEWLLPLLGFCYHCFMLLMYCIRNQYESNQFQELLQLGLQYLAGQHVNPVNPLSWDSKEIQNFAWVLLKRNHLPPFICFAMSIGVNWGSRQPSNRFELLQMTRVQQPKCQQEQGQVTVMASGRFVLETYIW